MKNLHIIVLLCGRVDSRTSFLHIFLSSSSLNYFYSVEDRNYWLSRRQTWQEQSSRHTIRYLCHFLGGFISGRFSSFFLGRSWLNGSFFDRLQKYLIFQSAISIVCRQLNHLNRGTNGSIGTFGWWLGTFFSVESDVAAASSAVSGWYQQQKNSVFR